MNKLAIPSLLLGVVMIAGAFAFMPVQEASTVHTSTATRDFQTNFVTLTAAMNPVTAATDRAIWTINQPFCVVSASYNTTTDANGNLNLDDVVAVTNLHLAGDTTFPTVGIIAVGASSGELLQSAVGDAPRICGTTTLQLTAGTSAGDAADVSTYTVIIETSGAYTATDAALS